MAVAQQQQVLARVGFLDAGVGDVLHAQRQLVLLLRAPVDPTPKCEAKL